jgi:diadenosine tetraphosphate (Ap4A) HIT family hydrolase
LSATERQHLHEAIDVAKGLIEKEYTPDGYNIGMNCVETAGQTVFHFHCHVIPGYKGDLDNPRGDGWHVMPEKGKY